MPKCDFNKVASSWVFSWVFPASEHGRQFSIRKKFIAISFEALETCMLKTRVYTSKKYFKL